MQAEPDEAPLILMKIQLLARKLIRYHFNLMVRLSLNQTDRLEAFWDQAEPEEAPLTPFNGEPEPAYVADSPPPDNGAGVLGVTGLEVLSGGWS